MTELVQANHMLTVETGGKGFYEISGEVAHWLDTLGADTGLVTVFVCHTSASLTIQENADPNVRLDLLVALDGLASEERPYAHQEEGADDMPSHIKSMLTSVSIGIPVQDGKMVLGAWQGLYLIEHRALAHQRHVALSFIGHSEEA
jgi:secondary thiamine-phosphate synthase enzyme